MPFDEDKQFSQNEKAEIEKNENNVEDVLKQAAEEQEKKEAEIEAARLENAERFEKESERRKNMTDLVEAMGIKTISEDVDTLKESVKAMAIKMTETIEAVNKISEVLSNGPVVAPKEGTAPNQGALDPEKLQQMGNFFEQLSHVWNNIKGGNAPPPEELIGQDFIKQKMKSAVLEDLETGENIRRFISTALKQKATKSVVNSALGDLGAAQSNTNVGKTHQYGPN